MYKKNNICTFSIIAYLLFHYFCSIIKPQNEITNMRKILFLLSLMICISATAKKTIPVFITAGQSNTDGRIGNELLPDYIQKNKYKHCYWCYNSGTHSMDGKFELFWPRIINKNKPGDGLTMP